VRLLVHDGRGKPMVVEASSLTVVACDDNADDANLLADSLNQHNLWNYEVVPVMTSILALIDAGKSASDPRQSERDSEVAFTYLSTLGTELKWS
jgi:hypothetical protein